MKAIRPNSNRVRAKAIRRELYPQSDFALRNTYSPDPIPFCILSSKDQAEFLHWIESGMPQIIDEDEWINIPVVIKR